MRRGLRFLVGTFLIVAALIVVASYNQMEGTPVKDCGTWMPMKDFVTWVCLIYAVVSLFGFWIMTYRRNKTLNEVRAAQKKRGEQKDFSAEGVLEKASKLVEAFTKAGPAISSLG